MFKQSNPSPQQSAVPIPSHLYLADDPIAQQTGWAAASEAGAKIGSHQLKRTSSTLYQFKCSTGAILGFVSFFFLGFASLITAASGVLTDDIYGTVILSLVGMLFSIGSVTLFYFLAQPINFDCKRQAFWRGRKDPSQVLNKSELEDYTAFSDIHAIQLLSEYIIGDRKHASYYNYEINLVLTDAARMNVIDQSDRELVIKNANIIAEFIGKPLWSGITHEHRGLAL